MRGSMMPLKSEALKKNDYWNFIYDIYNNNTICPTNESSLLFISCSIIITCELVLTQATTKMMICLYVALLQALSCSALLYTILKICAIHDST